MNIFKIFTDHPSSVNETYFEHMFIALGFSLRLAYASFAALVHSIFPFLFTKTASDTIKELYNKINSR